ncbi:MAG: MFS transporter [Loktanella sp.]|nr:MFS transporter [Loktanella sp.]
MSFFIFVRGNWPFLLAGFLFSLTSSYGQTFFISIFAGRIMTDFALTDGQWGMTYTVATTLSALLMIWGGALTDVMRSRTLSLIVMLGLAATCVAMALNTNALVLIAIVLCLRLFGQGMCSHLAIVSMARWYVATRGKALSIAGMGVALGTAVLPVVFAAAMDVISWRALWIVSAVIIVLTIPVIQILLQKERTPQSMAKETQATGMDDRHWTRAEVVMHPVFWLLLPALMGPAAWGTALFFQQVHLTEIKGWSLVGFTALFPLLSVVSVAGSLVSGAIIDRVGGWRILPFFSVPYIVLFLIMAQATTLLGAAVAIVLLGLGQGLIATLPGAFWSEFFGTRHIGSIKAAAGAATVFGTAIGPGVSGWLIDLGINFPTQMYGIAVYFVVAGILAIMAVRMAAPRLPVTA